MKVIVLVLPISSAVVVIVIRLVFSVSVSVGEVIDAFPEKTLVPYFVRNSLASRLTCLSSLAVTVKVTVCPSTTV